MTDHTPAILESRVYEPYGERLPYGGGSVGSSQTAYGFTGEPTDGNGLLYLRARYYNPAAGVFTALDPFEGIPSRPMSLNGYLYVEGNVPNRVDPSGMQAELAIGVPALTACALTPVCQQILLGIGIVVVVGAAAYLLQDEIRDFAGGLVTGFTNATEELRATLQQQGGQLNALNAMLQETMDCVHTAPPNRPATCGGTVVLPPGVEEDIENALDDSVIRRLRRWWWNVTDPNNTPDPNETPGPWLGPIQTPTPGPSPVQTPSPMPTCTPAPTATREPERVFFGQARITPNFSSSNLDANIPDFLSQQSIYTIAQNLRTGMLTTASLPIQAYELGGILVTINNRTLAALSLAGFRPTNVIRAVASPTVLARLTESQRVPARFGVPGNIIQPPSEYIAVTPGRRQTAVNDVTDVIRIAP